MNEVIMQKLKGTAYSLFRSRGGGGFFLGGGGEGGDVYGVDLFYQKNLSKIGTVVVHHN